MGSRGAPVLRRRRRGLRPGSPGGHLSRAGGDAQLRQSDADRGFDRLEIRDYELLPAGDRVVALIRTYSQRSEAGDLEVEVRDAHTMTFRDGKIIYWRLYLDQAEALQDAGLDPDLARLARPLGLLARLRFARGKPTEGQGRSAVALLVIRGLSLLVAAGLDDRRRGASTATRRPRKVLAARRLSARPLRSGGRSSFAAARGDVSFAVIDRSLGLRGYDYDRQFSSASVSKALLLAAELRRLDREGLPLDSETKALLEPMITYSDNRAADAVYAQVGRRGPRGGRGRAGMTGLRADGRASGAATGSRPPTWRGSSTGSRPTCPAPTAPMRSGCSPGSRPWSAGESRRRSGTGGRSGSRAAGARPGRRHNSGAVTHQAALLEHRRGERVGARGPHRRGPGDGGGFAAIEGVAARLLASAAPSPGRLAHPVAAYLSRLIGIRVESRAAGRSFSGS